MQSNVLLMALVVLTHLQQSFLVSCSLHPQGSTLRTKDDGQIHSSSSSFGFNSKLLSHEDEHQERPSVLVIDVDNCLYNEQDLKTNGLRGIEEQIVANIYHFGARYFNFTPDILEEMHRRHGSTIEGLRHVMRERRDSEENMERVLRQFYLEVYQDIDVSMLLPKFSTHARNTGYNHNQSHRKMQYIATQLKALRTPLYFASNSPKFHVLRILSALGLSDVPYHGLITPDSISGADLMYPTKNQPTIFYQELLTKFPKHHIVLLDDSLYNLDKAIEVGIEGIQVNHHHSLEEALAMYSGHILPASFVATHFLRNNQMRDDTYSFHDVQYIQEKNIVDESSLNSNVLETLGRELRNVLQVQDKGTDLHICDLGAGLLSMLKLLLFGSKRHGSLLSLLDLKAGHISSLRYTAYETNANLLQTNIDNLRACGFNLLSQDNNTMTFFRDKDDQVSVDVNLILTTKDFRLEDKGNIIHRPHLIVGCCFADLFNPPELAASVLGFITSSQVERNVEASSSVLVYFPITFSGTTQFNPSMTYNLSSMIPSDTLAFQMYRDHLETEYGHNTDVFKILNAFERFGMKLISDGPSNWEIDPERSSYLWQTLLYFFGLCAAPELLKSGWDSKGWIERARVQKPIIRVSNKDLLFSYSDNDFIRYDHVPEGAPNYRDELWFVGPRSVEKVRKEPYKLSPLQPGHVEVRSLFSLISSGTELKIFKGNFEEAPLDINIEDMKHMTMRYPLQYGYSLVGLVTRCASDLTDASTLVGRLVFTFSPHSSLIQVHRNSIQLVPYGIRAEDAIFLPSIETALSIVHDAKLNEGESVAVMGQGLIGLLVNAILSHQRRFKVDRLGTDIFNSVAVFDTSIDRLLVASEMGADQCLTPSEILAAGLFDVCIEVSGNPRALQSAIDRTKPGGRIVIASWYGNNAVSLKLGMDFHRSHKTLISSQVSLIPAHMCALWSKERRFNLAWDLLRHLQPSRLLTKIVDLDHAQEAYEFLDKGQEIVIAFKY